MSEVSPELVAYIKQELENGFSQDQILSELKKSDWDDEVVSLSLLEATSSPSHSDSAQISGLVEVQNKSKKPQLILVAAITLILVLLGLGYGYNRMRLAGEVEQANSLLKQSMEIDVPLDSGISFDETKNQVVDSSLDESSEGNFQNM